MSNETKERYVVEIERGWRFEEGNFESFMLARIFQVGLTPRWPNKRQKPVIVLGAPEATAESAAEQVRMWFNVGAPTADEAKASLQGVSA